jgi:flagellar basal body-associated protein FliL
VSVNAAAVVSGGVAIAEEANETNSAGNGFRDWMPTVIGAVIGVVVIGAIVIFLMLIAKKRKRAAEEEETEMSKAVPEHVVPETSISSVAVPATTSGATVEV